MPHSAPLSLIVSLLKTKYSEWPDVANFAFMVWPEDQAQEHNGQVWGKAWVDPHPTDVLTVGEGPLDYRGEFIVNGFAPKIGGGNTSLINTVESLSSHLRYAVMADPLNTTRKLKLYEGTVRMIGANTDGDSMNAPHARLQQVNLSIGYRLINI